MQRCKTQYRRILELDKRIRGDKYPNCKTFAREWEVTQKTIQRDIDFMRDQLRAPVAFNKRKGGYYYTEDTWFLPAVIMNEGDLFALLVASRALEAYRGTPVAGKLRTAFGKIAELLPDKISISPELVFNRFSFTSPPAKPVDEKIWTTLVRGLLHQQSVRIAYQPLTAKDSTKRDIDPYHIANLHGEWYVFAWCHRAEDIIQFAIPRIENARLRVSTFEMSDEFDPEKLLATTFGRFASAEGIQHVRLLFSEEVAPWVLERQWHLQQETKRRKNGDIELSFDTAGLVEVFHWVMAWGHNVTVLAPVELKNWVEEEVALMAGKHRRRDA